MLGIKVEKSKENLIINWQLFKMEIPIKEINNVFLGQKNWVSLWIYG